MKHLQTQSQFAFVNNIQDLYGHAGNQWLQRLDTEIEDLAKLWEFTLIHPIPELTYNFVAQVKINSSGKLAILKMGLESQRILAEVESLAVFSHAVPNVYAYNKQRNAFLMEYLNPGTSLKYLIKTGEDDKATRIIAATIRKLQTQQQPSDYKFPHLAEIAKGIHILKGKFDTKLLSQAESWFYDLTRPSKDDVVLHGDLHHDNILSTQSEWKAVDPHGYRGDPVAEVGAMIRNPWDCFPTHASMEKVIARRLKILADELPFDFQKIKAWAFCMTVLAAAWSFESHGKVTEEDVAAAIAKI